MYSDKKQVLVGARIPISLKEELSAYCLDSGVKMGYFVAQAIKEKLAKFISAGAVPDKKLFWFLKDSAKIDLSRPPQLDMFVQQVITRGNSQDIKALFKKITRRQFKESFGRIKYFLPLEVRKFWEDSIGDN